MYKCISKVKDLTPQHLVLARVMFREQTGLADKYLSFGNNNIQVAACGEWLKYELAAAACSHSKWA
jgi:hypothetical protein